jgi:hypothetical protein
MQHFDGTWVAALASLTRLTSLTLGYVEVDFAAPCPGFKFASLKALRKLNLSHVTFRSGTVSEIVCTVMPSLTSLNCCGTDPIGSPKELLRLKDMPALEELDLRDCFTEVPLQVLLQLTRLSSLTLSCGKPYGFPADASAANQIPNAQSTGGAAADEGRCSLPPRCMSLEHLLAVGKVMTELDSDGVLWWRVPYMLSCMKRLQKLEIFELLDNNDNAGWQAALIVGGLASAGSRPPIRVRMCSVGAISRAKYRHSMNSTAGQTSSVQSAMMQEGRPPTIQAASVSQCGEHTEQQVQGPAKMPVG